MPIYQPHYSNHPTLLVGCDSSATRRDPHPIRPLSPYERPPKSTQTNGDHLCRTRHLPQGHKLFYNATPHPSCWIH